MRKLFLLSLAVLLVGSASARNISTVQIAEKAERGVVSFSEFNALADAIDALTDIFTGTFGDLTEVSFPKKISVPQLCLGSTCKTGWPTPATPPWSLNANGISRLIGNVGIGVASPTAKLQVAGDIDVSGDIIQGGEPFVPVCGDGQPIIYREGRMACEETLDTYMWITGTYDSCDCAGLQSRVVACQKNGVEIVPDSSCTELKPDETISCSAPASCYAWQEGGFGECACDGTNTQVVECKNGEILVSDTFCVEAKPATDGTCEVPSSCYEWEVGDYSDCTCSGSQLRTVICQNNGVTVADSFCTTSKPSEFTSCTSPSSCYAWSTGAWGECDCDTATQERSVNCKNGTTNVSDSFCTASKPDASQSCQLPLSCCDYTSESTCSVIQPDEWAFDCALEGVCWVRTESPCASVGGTLVTDSAGIGPFCSAVPAGQTCGVDLTYEGYCLKYLSL